ncbi:spermidine synthase [Archangium gephyra]|uniref:spermidine synthase n=1 Tax=Archangium gephyra TaxID=48 RepID=UPI003B760423
MSLYAFTLFLGAFLLFGVQPLAGKYALPWFGGTPAVWTTCMLFFQAVLLGGYAYSHASIRRLTPRRQARVHLGLLGLTVAVLVGRALWAGSPVAPGPEWRPPADGISTPRLLVMLAATLGLPFFTLSTTAPLLQSWFSRVRPGVSPYRLYALSNAGSLLSLLAYPFLVEPWLGRGVQAWGWGAGFLVFAVSCAACARGVMRQEDAPVAGNVPEADGGPAPGVGRTLAWLGLSAGASVLLLGATNQLSQDVAAGPFVWVLPLALYLLTFIIAFEREALYSRPLTALLLLLAVGGVTRATLLGPHVPLLQLLLVHAGALFAGALLCHGELYRLRPSPRYLSTFYLWVSAGGVAGGLFVHLLAPRLFRSYAEYPLMLGVCCLLAVLLLLRQPLATTRARTVLSGVCALLLLIVAGSLGLAVVETRRSLESSRNFFGVLRVGEVEARDSEAHAFMLVHGNVLHGYQYTRPERRSWPTSYFTPGGGLGLALTEQRRLRETRGLPPTLRVGVLGLGVGTTAAMARAGDVFRFYEINPQVIALAQGAGGYFSFLSDSPARVEVVEGDARIMLEQELSRGEPQGFDVLALDVFSSDSIPVHLFTEEAVDVYRRHLAPGGVLALHLSSVHLDLLPLALAHARTFGLHAMGVESESEGSRLASLWVMLSLEPGFSRGETFARQSGKAFRLGLSGPPRVRWTDERSSVLPLMAAFGVDHRDILQEQVESAAVAVPSGP